MNEITEGVHTRANGSRRPSGSGVRQSPGSKAEGMARRFAWSVEEGVGRRPGQRAGDFAGRLLGRRHGTRETAGRHLRTGGMVLTVLARRFGVVVVDRTVVVVMVLNTLALLEHVRERRRAVGVLGASLHGETIQGQAEQQEDVDDAAQEDTLMKSADYSSLPRAAATPGPPDGARRPWWERREDRRD